MVEAHRRRCGGRLFGGERGAIVLGAGWSPRLGIGGRRDRCSDSFRDDGRHWIHLTGCFTIRVKNRRFAGRWREKNSRWTSAQAPLVQERVSGMRFSKRVDWNSIFSTEWAVAFMVSSSFRGRPGRSLFRRHTAQLLLTTRVLGVVRAGLLAPSASRNRMLTHAHRIRPPRAEAWHPAPSACGGRPLPTCTP